MSEERASEVGDVAPSSLSHLIGQRSVIAQVSVALDAAFADGKKIDHSLLRRPSRTWKIGIGPCHCR